MRVTLTLAIGASIAAAPIAAADGRPEQGTPARGLYVGVFGGGGVSSSTDVNQLGTVFFEIEGLYLDAGTRRATLQNPTLRLTEHTFDDSFPTNDTVFLANLVLSFPKFIQGVTPYVGGGIGGAQVDVDGAKSIQVNPPEAGINHFNSGTDSSAWTFAAQVKAGARVALGSNAYVFGEYRYLYTGSTDQIFGPTVDPIHAPTTAWTDRFDATSHHLGAVGLGFSF